MTKRVKPVLQTPTVSSVAEADAALAEIAARKRQIELHELDLKEEVDRLKGQCADACEPLKQDIAAREQALLQFSLSRREELFRNKKSLDLNFGVLGFRASTALKTVRKFTWARVLALVKEKGLPCVRIKEEVDKEALRALGEEQLKTLGCRLVQEDAFFYELKETGLAEDRGGAA